MNTNKRAAPHFTPTDFAAILSQMSKNPSLLHQLTGTFTQKELPQASKDFLFGLKLENRTPATLRYYRQHLDYFLAQPLPRYVHEITEEHIKDYLKTKQTSVYMMHGSYRALRAFFNWAIKEHYYLGTNPVLSLKAPKLPQKKIPVIAPEGFKALVKSCDDKFLGRRNKAIIYVLYDTGIRLQELTNLKLSDIDLGNGLLKIIGKGNKERMVRMGRETVKVLWNYLKIRGSQYEQLWLTEERTPIQANGLGQAIKHMSKEAGIPNISPHKFRHSFAVNFLRNGGNLFSLQILLGHTDLTMVRRYTSVLDTDDAILSHEKFGPVDHLGLK
jgi:site-specific recombinase XerD